jgi:ABC-type sugar transport system substrate-binding protein
MIKRPFVYIAFVALGGCGSKLSPSYTASKTDKIGVLVSSKSDPWIAQELKVMSASPSFSSRLDIREAADIQSANAALAAYKAGGDEYVVVLAPEDTYDGDALLGDASAKQLKLVALHWRLYGPNGKASATPFIGVHQIQIGDAVAKDVLKNTDIAGAKCLLVGPQSHSADFFARLTATLQSHLDMSRALKCDVPLNRPEKDYKGPVMSTVGKVRPKQKWLVIGADDYCALGAAKVLSAAGASPVFGYGVGAYEPAQRAWDRNEPIALESSVFLNPYLEVEALAKVIRKWKETGKTTRNVPIGGPLVHKTDYKAQIKNLMMPTGGDLG